MPFANHHDIVRSAVQRRSIWLHALAIAALLYLFLIGIRGLGGGFKLLGGTVLDDVFAATSNPFVGLAIGILTTTLVQSSSVTTALVVGIVAAPDSPLPVAHAIPIVMGANIGTSVTNTVVSLGHVRRPNEFRRAFAAATVHDFFNWMAVAILLPLELATGVLEKASGAVAGLIPVGFGGSLPNPVKGAAGLVIDPVEAGLSSILSPVGVGVVFIASFGGVVFVSLYFLVRTLRALSASRVEQYMSRALDERPVTGMAVGCVSTAMVQSSSITTSMLVPFAGAGIITLEQLFPVTLGANIGTTLTALLAAAGAPAETLHLAVQISLVHLLFNLSGVLLIYPARALRNIPLRLARALADVAVRSKTTAFAYVVGLFYALPALLTLLWRAG